MNKALDLKSLEELAVDSSFTRELPGDPVRENFRRQVAGACYSHVDPVQFPKAELIAYSKEIALELGIDLGSCESDQFTRVFSGSELLQNMTPYACCYGGHQFGNWAGQLGTVVLSTWEKSPVRAACTGHCSSRVWGPHPTPVLPMVWRYCDHP